MPQKIVLLILILVLITGSWGYARNPPTQDCNPAYALHIEATADARGDGYRLSGHSGNGLFRLAAYDLIQGRINFFEAKTSSGNFSRYQLADSHSTSCIARQPFDAQLAELPFPVNTCIGARPVPAPASRFLVESDWPEADQSPTLVSIRDLQEDKLLAQYQQSSKIRRWIKNLIGKTPCDLPGTQSEPALWMITGFVFPDRWGQTVTRQALQRIHEEGDNSPTSAGYFPPLASVRRQLAQEGRLDRESCSLPGWMGATEVHRLELARGPLDMDARLDASSTQAGVVLVDVHVPDKAVIILAQAQGPTVWHIHESSSSSIVAVLVHGHHGQAVVGLTPFSRILMSTQLHNPLSQCSEQALGEIEANVVRQYGITLTQRQDPTQSPPVVRYSIGEPMRDGAELFHHHLSVADFEVRDTP